MECCVVSALETCMCGQVIELGWVGMVRLRCSVWHVAPGPWKCPQSRVLQYDNELYRPLRTLWEIGLLSTELLNFSTESILATFHNIKQKLALFPFFGQRLDKV